MDVILPVIVSLLFYGLIQDATCSCNVTCTTDYSTSLNCSCSGKMPPFPFLLEAECRYDEDEFNGSCEVKPSQGWCLIQSDDFYTFTYVETECTARVKHTDKQHKMKTSDSRWKLSHMVKPLHPFNVQVTETNEYYNVTWEIPENNFDDNQMYSVRIRTKDNISQRPIYVRDQRYVVINHIRLLQGTEYMVDVQASMGPSSIYKGPWSEWSSTTEWRTTNVHAADGTWYWYILPITMVVVFVLLTLCYRKLLWLKIPSPDDFFKPLYITYEGDFKKWVRPVFSESDLLVMNTPSQVMTEKHLEVHRLSCKSLDRDSSIGENHQGDRGQGRISVLGLPPHSSSLLYFEGGSGHGTSHSTGHVSIDTVTVSGEEGAVSGRSQQTNRSSQVGASFCPYTGGRREGDLLASRADEEGGVSRQSGGRRSIGMLAMEWQPQGRDIEPEQISLDSSEDGYPRVDLDTIDSGFVESDCSSPVNTDFDVEQQIDSALLSGVGNSHSNYVKQWVACNTVQVDPSNTGQ